MPRQPRALSLAALMLVAGVAHFVVPKPYQRIVPRALGHPAFWVRWSGVAELACAALLVDRRTRRTGALATVAVLVAVFPANVQMALDGGPLAWARLPLQIPLVLWARSVAKASPPVDRPVE